MSKFIPNSFQIPNAFVDDYLDQLSGKAVKCYLLIARKTTGWRKDSDRISISQFMEKCGIKNRKTAYSAIEELEAVKLVKVERKQGEINEFSLNFFIDENDDLAPVPKNGTSTKNSSSPVPKNGTSTSTKNWYSTKDNIKNNITNNTLTGINAREETSLTPRKTVFDFSEEDLKAAHWIFSQIKKLNPNHKPPNFERWANDVRLMRTADKRSHLEICEMFKFANNHHFWCRNILSPEKLRKKWDQLVIERNASAKTQSKDFTPDDDTNWAKGMTIRTGGFNA